MGAEWDSPTGGFRPDPADGDLAAGTPGGVTLTPEAAAGTATQLGAVTTTGRAAPAETATLTTPSARPAAATPTKPERLINEVAVGLVFVDAPEGSQYGMDLDEIVDAIAEVQDGTEWLAAQQPSANITWSYDIHIVTVDVEPWTGANWPGLPDEWYGGSDGTGTAGIDAALMRSSNGKIYLFRGSEYVRYSSVANGVDAGYPKPIAGNWNGLPASFTSGIDAAFMRESNQKIYFFKGNQYARIDTTTSTMDAGYPKPIAGNWPGLPASFTSGIDAALQRKDNDKIYFFKGDQYVRFSAVADGVDAGYPKSLDPNWGGHAGRLPGGHRRRALARQQRGGLPVQGRDSTSASATCRRVSTTATRRRSGCRAARRSCCGATRRWRSWATTPVPPGSTPSWRTSSRRTASTPPTPRSSRAGRSGGSGTPGTRGS